MTFGKCAETAGQGDELITFPGRRQVCAPVGGGGGHIPHTWSHWKTALSAPACPFVQDMGNVPTWGPPALQPGHPEDGHPEDGHPSTVPTAPPHPAVSFPMGGTRTPLHWEPLQRVGAAPWHTL